MNISLPLLIERLTNAEYLFALISLHVALLSSTLIFIGFVQVALSSSLNTSENRLTKQVTRLVSRGIIRRVRIIVGMTMSGAFLGWIGYVTASIFITAASSLLFLITLLIVGSLSYSITHEFLFLGAGVFDGDKEI